MLVLCFSSTFDSSSIQFAFLFSKNNFLSRPRFVLPNLWAYTVPFIVYLVYRSMSLLFKNSVKILFIKTFSSSVSIRLGLRIELWMILQISFVSVWAAFFPIEHSFHIHWNYQSQVGYIYKLCCFLFHNLSYPVHLSSNYYQCVWLRFCQYHNFSWYV